MQHRIYFPFFHSLSDSFYSISVSPCLATLVGVTQADIDGYGQLSEKVTERYNRVVTWADLFSHSTIEAKKMILAQFINQVRVGRDYHMEIDLNANYEMFGEMLQEDQEEEKSHKKNRPNNNV